MRCPSSAQYTLGRPFTANFPQHPICEIRGSARAPRHASASAAYACKRRARQRCPPRNQGSLHDDARALRILEALGKEAIQRAIRLALRADESAHRHRGVLAGVHAVGYATEGPGGKVSAFNHAGGPDCTM